MAGKAMSVETSTETVANNSTADSASGSQTDEAESVVRDKTDDATPTVNISAAKGSLDPPNQSSLKLKRTSNNNVVNKSLVSSERKQTVSMNSHAPNSVKTTDQSDTVIGAKLNFGLEQKTSNDKEKNVGQKPKQNNSLQIKKDPVARNKSKTFPLDKAPHTNEKLLETAVNIVDDCKSLKSSTCPEPEFVDHTNAAVTLNCVPHRTLDDSADGKIVERELQDLNSKDASREREGLWNRKAGSVSRNYGSIEMSDTTPPASSFTSSPEEEPGNTVSTSVNCQSDINRLTSSEPLQEEHKKKKKRKKKKKGPVESEQATSNSSDHENKVTSPGTSGGEDIVKSKPLDLQSPTVPNTMQKNLTPLNGPNATRTKLSVSQNKTKKSETLQKTGNSNTEKHIDNLQSKNTFALDAAADENKIVRKSIRASVKDVNQSKLLDNTDKVDAMRTKEQTGNTSIICTENVPDAQKLPDANVVEPEHVTDGDKNLDKSTSEKSIGVNREKGIDEPFNQEEDDSNENEWRSAPRRTKRRATTLEDRPGSMYNRPSQTDNFRRAFGSDYRLRKSSSEPSGMSRLMEENQGSYRHRNSFASRSQVQRDDYHTGTRRVETLPTSDTVEKPPVPILQNTYAEKLKGKPPTAPNGSNKKVGQENQATSGDHQVTQTKQQDLVMKVENNGAVVPSVSQSRDDSEQKEKSKDKQISENAMKHNKANSGTSMGIARDANSSIGLTSDANVAVRGSVVSATTAAKSASLPRDLGRKPGTVTPKARLDDTSADNVVQYLDLQCSNDTYAARLKQSINSKPAESMAKPVISSTRTKVDKPQPADGAKPPRISRLESSHKAVSLDSATHVTTVMPKKTNSASGKDKDSMRSVKSETSLNLTAAEGSAVSQHNFFPFEAEPSASFDIMFGSVKFSESDFELIDEVTQNTQQKIESDSSSVPLPKPSDQPSEATSKKPSSPPPTSQVSCEELEKSWIAASPPSNAIDNQNTVPRKDSAKSSSKETPAPTVAPGLAAILSGGNINSPVSTPINDHHTKNAVRADELIHDDTHAIDSVFQKRQWYCKFNHVELAEMLLKDWQNFKSELADQTPKVMIYDED